MKALHKYVIVIVLSLFIASAFLAVSAYAQSSAATTAITEWEMMWEEDPDSTVQDVSSKEREGEWALFSEGNASLGKPVDIDTAWMRVKVPSFDLVRPALSIKRLTARDVTIYINNQIVYNSHRNYPYNKNEIILPLSANESNIVVYIKLATNVGLIGVQGNIHLGEFQQLEKGFMKYGILDVILGAALVFIACGLLICFIFIKKSYLAAGNSLTVIILSVGLMIFTYSPFLHMMYPQIGIISYYSFDLGSTLLMPSIFFFFERVFGKGPFKLIYRFRKLHVIFAVINTVFLIISFISHEVRDWYTIFGAAVFAIFILISNILLIILLAIYCKQRNKEAIILSVGFSMFAVIGGGELAWYYIKQLDYYMFVWKWGILCFLGALVIILARRSIFNYEQMVKYSKQMDIFNNELQRSEKMEIISQLAASVAHEVRNPLQVTRGFLQIIGEKANSEKDKTFMLLAIEELDRASEIITDFLTFAKPQLEQTTILNIGEELQQIEGILVPLATMQGGLITVDLESNLYVRGNSSKFKQALINIIKNSIEALGQEGTIHIRAYENKDTKNVIIRIKDNGEGMTENDLKRLGEPYYSKKTKGTGLGLMVTFRIIEVMQGTLHFTSKKGFGTEAIIEFQQEIKEVSLL
ncbi:sensor histidine kinase [Paenibacillus sp. FJAT-27812]|uniref:sensor histidine kinase n=1 Tax=Paenibacillus sp. FJAT-27812 TaxID=1684143 RepID=UPI0006A7B4DC|nr:HAMP domain-containing sensor histidine kinase [Paenibacillus sp. FJAT-27812]